MKPPAETSTDVDRLLAEGVPDLYRYLVRLTGGDRLTAEDLVQETCLDLVRAAQSGSAGELGVGWMIVVGRRRYLDRARSQLRATRRLEAVGETPTWTEPDWSVVEGSDVLDCLGALPADQRAALVFRYVDDLPVSEVASLVDRSVSATESLLARARRALAAAVEEVRRDAVG